MERIMKLIHKKVVNDRTNRAIPMDNVIGFCVTNNDNIGLLLDDESYDINQLYVGKDLMLHMSPLSIGTVDGVDMSTEEGVQEYNSKITILRDRIIKSVTLLDGTVITA